MGVAPSQRRRQAIVESAPAWLQATGLTWHRDGSELELWTKRRRNHGAALAKVTWDFSKDSCKSSKTTRCERARPGGEMLEAHFYCRSRQFPIVPHGRLRYSLRNSDFAVQTDGHVASLHRRSSIEPKAKEDREQ